LKATILAQEYEVNNLASTGTPSSLSPDEDFFYQQKIEIVDLSIEQVGKIIEEFNRDDLFVIFNITVKYNQLGTNKSYAVLAKYKITKSNAVYLNYEEFMTKN
jgi:hypothetical protein